MQCYSNPRKKAFKSDEQLTNITSNIFKGEKKSVSTAVSVLISAVLNVQTCGEPHGLDNMALYNRSHQWTAGSSHAGMVWHTAIFGCMGMDQHLAVFGLQGCIQMSADVWNVAPQAHLQCHTPHMQACPVWLLCLGNPSIKKTQFHRVAHMAAVHSIQNQSLAGQSHALADRQSSCLVAALGGLQEPR